MGGYGENFPVGAGGRVFDERLERKKEFGVDPIKIDIAKQAEQARLETEAALEKAFEFMSPEDVEKLFAKMKEQNEDRVSGHA